MKRRNALSGARAEYLFAPRVVDVACLISDAVGDCMCIRGDRIGDRWRVTEADPFDEAKMPAVGILLSKLTPTTGEMQILGPCDLFTGLDWASPGYFVGASGITDTAPAPAPGGWVLVQHIGKPVADDLLLLTGENILVKRRG